MVKVLNPFSVSLKTYPFMELSGKPVFVHPLYSNYTIWKYSENHFVSCYYNIVVHETTGAPIKIISDFAEGKMPKDDVRKYFDWERIADAIENGKKYLKENNLSMYEISGD